MSQLYTHTHTCTPTHALTHMYTSLHAHTCKTPHTLTHTYTHVHTHTCTHVHTCTHIHTCTPHTYTFTHLYTCPRCPHTCTHSVTHTHAHTRTHKSRTAVGAKGVLSSAPWEQNEAPSTLPVRVSLENQVDFPPPPPGRGGTGDRGEALGVVVCWPRTARRGEASPRSLPALLGAQPRPSIALTSR